MAAAISLNRLHSTDATTPNSDVAPWFAALREHGRTAFSADGIPNRTVEAWKYSDLAQALGETHAASDAAVPLPSLSGTAPITIENGILDPAAALPPVELTPLRAVMTREAPAFASVFGQVNPPRDHAILDLNTALMADGFVLRIPKGMTLDTPIHLRFRWHGGAAPAADGCHVRLLILLEEGSAATFVESHTGSPSFATIVTELQMGPAAQLTHVRLERLGAAARQSAAMVGGLGRSARYHGVYVSEGAHFARHEAHLMLAGDDAEAQIDGTYWLAGDRHCDNTTVVTHAALQTVSRQSFRGVLGGRSRGVYQGCVRVQPGAQGTDARQMSRALLLSRQAQIATKPELEILADDVKCSHGATAGALDAAALFFLRARGIPEAEARALLIEAFLTEALAAIPGDELHGLTTASLHDWLSRHASEISHVE